MKRLVDGAEIEFPDQPIEVERLSDRLLVKTKEGAFTALVIRDRDTVLVSYKGRQYKVETATRRAAAGATNQSGELRAPMPGVVVAVKAAIGEKVSKGDVILVLEAMKTQQPFVAPFDAHVEDIAVNVGQSVTEGTLLAFLKSLADN